jgi:hypothetical protein
MVHNHLIPLEEQRIMWRVLSLSLLKSLGHEKIRLTRSGKYINGPQFVAEHEKYVTLQYTILEEFFKQVFLYFGNIRYAKDSCYTNYAENSIRTCVSELWEDITFIKYFIMAKKKTPSIFNELGINVTKANRFLSEVMANLPHGGFLTM